MGYRGILYTGMIFVAVLLRQAIGQDIGKCSRTTFTNGGQQCQRTMMSSLTSNSSINCSDAYKKQSTCLDDHVGSCVKGTQYSFAQREIVKLLTLLLYHCGVLSFDVAKINPLVLQTVQCDGEELKRMVNCWDEFRATFSASRNDSSLCRKYAEGKQNCTTIARESCAGICIYISKDEYNPFCNNTMDPPGTSDLFDCIRTLGCSNKVVYENAVKCEKVSFENFANNTGHECSAVLKKNKDCLRQSLVGQCPSMAQKNEVFEDVVKTLRATLMTQQFFCDKVTLDKDSLHRSVKTVTGDCKSKFFTTAEKCAEPFRKIYTSAAKKMSSEVCSAFAEAKKCLNKAHEENCNFDENTLKAAMFDEKNPFCESGKDPELKKSRVSRAQGTTLLLFTTSIAFGVLTA